MHAYARQSLRDSAFAQPFKRTLALATAAAFALILSLAGTAHAADKPGSKDHPLISRFPGASIEEYAVTQFDEIHLPTKAFSSDDNDRPAAGKVLTVEGKITAINYKIAAGTSMLEVSRNYEQALAGKGFTILYKCHGDDDPAGSCNNLASYVVNSGKVAKSSFGGANFGDDNRYLLAKHPSPQGDVYVMVYAMQGNAQASYVDLIVVEVAPMKAGQITVTDAAALKQSLAQQGRAAIYGIYFDTAKAEVKPESKPALDEMAKLLKNDPKLNVYVVGHTDNQGTLTTNLDLSQHRADAVVKSLVTDYHVDQKRLLAKGVASLAPVANNADDAGRALNRRVELVTQ